MNNHIHHVSFKKILSITYPIVLSMFSLNLMQFVDRTFIAWHSLEQFSAVMPSGAFATAIASIFLGITGYISVLVANYFGASRYKECSHSMWQGVYLSFVFGLILIAVSPFGSEVFWLLGHDKNIIPYEKQYYYLIIWTSCVQMFFNSLSGFFNGIGKTKIPMITQIIGNVLNIILDWIFIFGKFGLPSMGLFGAGLATLISSIVSLLILFIIIYKNEFREKYLIFKEFKPSTHILKKIIRFGFPAGVQFFLGFGTYSFFFLIIGMIGEIQLSCANIAFTIEALSFLPVLGIGTAISIIVGQEKGAERHKNIPEAVKKGLIIAFIYNFIMISLFNIFPEFLVSIFNSGKEPEKFILIKETSVILIRLTSIWIIFDSIQFIISNALKAAGDTVFILIAEGLIPFILILGSAYIFAVLYRFSLPYIWSGIIICVILMAIAMTVRFLSGAWEKIKII